MIYILDTDVLTIAELPDSPEYRNLHARVLQLESTDRLVTTIVTYEEQTRGWLAYAAKSRELPHQIKAYARLSKHLQSYKGLTVLAFDAQAGEEYQRLRGLKLPVGGGDLKIASIVLAQKAVLLSRNMKDFSRIPNLAVEDWTAP